MKDTAPVNGSRAALHLVAGGLARGVAGEALLAGFQKLLRPAVIETLDNVLASTQRGDALFAAQNFKKQYGSFLLPNGAAASCGGCPGRSSRPGLSRSLISVSSLCPSVIAMSQKSSVMKTLQFVPKVLMSGKDDKIDML